jgi:hypothetical protein
MSTNIKQTSTARSIVSLNLPGPVPALISYVQTVYKGLNGNPHCPTTTPPLTAIDAAINALVASHASATKPAGMRRPR